MKCFSVLLFVVCMHIVVGDHKLIEKFSWKEISYDWKTEGQKEEAITSKRYISENNLILGLDVWQDKLFITVPRYIFRGQI